MGKGGWDGWVQAGRWIALTEEPHCLSRTERLTEKEEGHWWQRDKTGHPSLLFPVCVPVYSTDVYIFEENKTRQGLNMCIERQNWNKSHPEKPPLSPLGVCTHRETPNCTGDSLCISKCNTTVLDFSILFVWSGVSIPIYFKLCKKRLWAGYFFIYIFFLFQFWVVFFFHFVFFLLRFGLFTLLWAWTVFGLHFSDSETSSSFYHVWEVFTVLF